MDCKTLDGRQILPSNKTVSVSDFPQTRSRIEKIPGIILPVETPRSLKRMIVLDSVQPRIYKDDPILGKFDITK